MKSLSEGKVTEGWQGQMTPGTRRFHYIRDTESLCRSIFFYTGPLDPDMNSMKSEEECAKCWRILESERNRDE